MTTIQKDTRITAETITELLQERVDCLHVNAVPNLEGNGYDVVFRLDGTYFVSVDTPDPYNIGLGPLEQVAYWREMIGQALLNSGVDMTRRHNWDRDEPWLKGLTEADIASVIDAGRDYRAEA